MGERRKFTDGIVYVDLENVSNASDLVLKLYHKIKQQLINNVDKLNDLNQYINKNKEQ